MSCALIFLLLFLVAGYGAEARAKCRLQALVYDTLLLTTAVFSYAIGSRKLSANEQFFFVGAQTAVSLLQTTQIKQGVSFIATNKVYTSTNRTTTVWIETEFFFSLPGVDASHVYVRALGLGCFYSQITVPLGGRWPRHAGGQLSGDKECPFSGVTKSGRVWRKVSESGGRSEHCAILLSWFLLQRKHGIVLSKEGGAGWWVALAECWFTSTETVA